MPRCILELKGASSGKLSSAGNLRGKRASQSRCGFYEANRCPSLRSFQRTAMNITMFAYFAKGMHQNQQIRQYMWRGAADGAWPVSRMSITCSWGLFKQRHPSICNESDLQFATASSVSSVGAAEAEKSCQSSAGQA